MDLRTSPTNLGRQHHEPMLCSTYRYGAWCCCTCGWISRTYTTVGGAHIAFGEHLLRSL